MPDIWNREKRSEVMSKIHSRDTDPEVQLRRELFQRGFRYRVNRKGLAGRPDIVFPRERLAVFVDGCFWHGCPVHYEAPMTNAPFWNRKLRENRRRDERATRHLQAEGWAVIRFWEHEIEADVARCANLSILELDGLRKQPLQSHDPRLLQAKGEPRSQSGRS